MRRRTLTALGVGATTGLATGALVTTGVVGASLGLVLAPPLPAPAAAESLQAFADCEQLRQWYVDAALPMVGPWGFGGWPGYYDGGLAVRQDTAMPADARSTTGVAESGLGTGETAVGNGPTGTNVQEAGVDEPDVAKADGTLVVAVSGRDLVVTDVTGDPREVGRVQLPGGLHGAELLLLGDTVLALGTSESYGYFPQPMTQPMDTPSRIAFPAGPVAGTTHLATVDISDPASPRVTRTDRIDGRLVAAREQASSVRLVVATSQPPLDFVTPNSRRTPAEATRENRRIVRESGVDDWLPSVRTGSAETPLLECSDVRHPEDRSGLGTLSVVTFEGDDFDSRTATAVTADSDLVYSSADRLYLATTTSTSWQGPMPLPDWPVDAPPAPDGSIGSPFPKRPPLPRTVVHAFALDGLSTTYVASGEVPGTVRDRWSFSEYDGHLRVATALGRDAWAARENAVTVLAERGDRLVVTGQVSGMGIREQIQSVRWLGALAVIVTFRQTDPLYTLDLSDPERPRLLGELKIPGFSAYLHPLGDDRLLGLGQSATLTGRTTGAQAAVFDLGDLTRPRRLSTLDLGRDTDLTATSDPRAFTYLPQAAAALSPLQSYRTGATRLVILRVGEDASISRTLTGRLTGWDTGGLRALPIAPDRVAVVVRGAVVETLSL